MTSNKSKSSKGKLALVLMAFAVLAMSSIACDGNDDTVTPTPEVITGEVTADALIEDAQDAVEDTASALCTACLVGELLGGDSCNCNAICNAEVECKSVEQGE